VYKKRVANAALFSFWLGGSWRVKRGGGQSKFAVPDRGEDKEQIWIDHLTVLEPPLSCFHHILAL